MNKIKQILIGASMLALSGNAAAMMINVDGTDYNNFKSLVPVIEDIVNRNLTTNLSEKKLNKLTTKFEKYNNRLEAGKGVHRVKKSIKRKMKKWGVTAQASISPIIGGDECCNGGTDVPGSSVPEPSTLALLGLGLVGIGAERRLRKKAR